MGKKRFFQAVISKVSIFLIRTKLTFFSVKKQAQIQNKQFCNSNIFSISIMPG